MRRSLVLFLIALSALAASVTSASAATETRTVPGEFVFEHGSNPQKPGNCSAIAFVRWAHQAGTVAKSVSWATHRRGRESKAVAPPFDDHYEWVRSYDVAAGSHWTAVGKSWKDGREPDDCGDLSAKQRGAYVPGSAQVELARVEPPSLAVSVRANEAGRTRPNADSLLTVSVKNTGSVPVEFVSVNSSTKIKVIKRSCRGAVLRTGRLVNGGQGTIAPGETHVPAAFFEVTHLCAGSADVTVSVRGRTADGTEVTGRGTARVVVPATARIRGTVKPVPAWPAAPYASWTLPSDEVAKLRQGITVRAKGPKGTLSTRVTPSGTYEIEVPRKALGRYVVTTSAPKATELRPGRVVVNLRAGETAVRNYEAGYSCETKLPGRGFAVKGGSFNGALATYRCRSRRLLLRVPLRPGRYDENEYLTTCTRADGSTYEVGSSHDFVELLLAMGTDGVLRGGFAGYGNLSVTASFTTPASLDVRVDSTDCLEDQDFVLKRSR